MQTPIKHLPEFLAIFSWITAFNPDPWIKGLSVLATIFAIAASISTIRKNRRKS